MFEILSSRHAAVVLWPVLSHYRPTIVALFTAAALCVFQVHSPRSHPRSPASSCSPHSSSRTTRWRASPLLPHHTLLAPSPFHLRPFTSHHLAPHLAHLSPHRIPPTPFSILHRAIATCPRISHPTAGKARLRPPRLSCRQSSQNCVGVPKQCLAHRSSRSPLPRRAASSRTSPQAAPRDLEGYFSRSVCRLRNFEAASNQIAALPESFSSLKELKVQPRRTDKVEWCGCGWSGCWYGWVWMMVVGKVDVGGWCGGGGGG